MLGVYTDTESNLIHMRARYYSPYLKRFIRRDPIGFEGGMNHYAFAAGNPISFADPSGLGPIGNSSFGQGFNTGFTAGQNMDQNTGQLLGTAFGSLFSGNFVRALGATLALPTSYLAGDIFGTAPDATARQFVKYVNGIFTGRRAAFDAGGAIGERIGSGVEVVYNPTFAKIGDLIQILFGELKIPTISSLWLADSLNATGGGHVYAHSQGGNVTQLTWWFTSSSVRANTTSLSIGSQTTLTIGNTRMRGFSLKKMTPSS